MRIPLVLCWFTWSLCVPVLLWAQPPDEDLQNEEVEVIRDFEARLLETEKLPIEPVLPAVDDKHQSLDYTIPARVMRVDYPPPKIKPLAMGRDKAPPVYNGYAKAGYGMFNQPFLQAGYSYVNPELLDLQVRAHHHSGNNDNNEENQRFSLSGGSINATYYQEKELAIDANVGYQSNNRFLYGYDDEEFHYTKEEVQRRINTLDVGARIYNTTPLPGDINYEAGVKFYDLKEKFLASEENGSRIFAGGSKYFKEKHLLAVDLTLDLSTFNDTTKQTLHNFYLHPHFTYHHERFKLRIGVNAASHDDEFFFFPDLEAAAAILGTQLGAYVGWSGDLQKNSFRNLIQYNPYVASYTQLKNTEYNRWYGGVRGLIKDYTYHAEVGFKKANNIATFLPKPSDERQFDVIYDDMDIVYVSGTVQGSPMQDLSLMFTLGHHFFSPENLEKAWHLPSLELNFGAQYQMLDNRLKLMADLYGADGIPYASEDGSAERLDPLYDLSLGSEYTIVENIGAWLQLNNVLSNKRERWQRYPMFGFNVMAGVVAKF